ncbi:hypothetical protein AK973_6044 [Pseudomonas brassicacearum]|nr:hypothetical protein AK973_6044 [Pseudomonas brassicacearum]
MQRRKKRRFSTINIRAIQFEDRISRFGNDLNFRGRPHQLARQINSLLRAELIQGLSRVGKLQLKPQLWKYGEIIQSTAKGNSQLI